MERNLIEDKARIVVDTELIKPGIARKLRQLKKHDKGTFRHSLNMAYISTEIAIRLELSEELISQTALGGLLHDIGKLCVPRSILQKRGYLSDEEYKIVMKHPEYGLKECAELDLPQATQDIIFGHHERIDGSGYPRGITSEQMPIYLKIASLVDSYDAMTSYRSYKDAYSSTASIGMLSLDDAYSQRILEELGEIRAK